MLIDGIDLLLFVLLLQVFYYSRDLFLIVVSPIVLSVALLLVP